MGNQQQELEESITSIVLEFPPQHIALFKAVIESYDNLATLRTADPQRHHLKLWFAPSQRTAIDEILEEFAAICHFRRIG